jgi:hypothetical protein
VFTVMALLSHRSLGYTTAWPTILSGWSSSLISKIWLSACRSGISKISILKTYIWKIVSYTTSLKQFCLKKWEELIYYGKSWNIRQVFFEYLMYTNFVALTFCLKTMNCFPFQRSSLKFHKLPFNLRKNLRM